MIKRIILYALLLATVSGISQENIISGTIAGLENENIYLMQLMGEKRKIVDTTQTDLTGAFTFTMPEVRQPGMYVVIKGPGQAVELIYNKENIQFTTSGFDVDDGIQIVSSIENLIYYDYLGIKGMNMYKLDVLHTLLENYPPNDEFFQEALKQFNFLQTQLVDRINELIDGNPNTLASRYIKTDRPVFADLELSDDEQNIILKKHYFDYVDFSDTMLIRSTILTSKVVGYLSLYQNNASSQEELEENMLIGVDSVLSYAQQNQQVYEFLIDFLINGFESIGFEKGLEHIAEASSLDKFCENTERKLKLENKLELIKKLAIGQPAPNFVTKDINGKEIDLSKIDAEKTVIVFWASWCSHCDAIMPIINSKYSNNKDMEVIAISIDESKDDLMKSIAENNYGWIQVAELNGWNGAIVEEYGIVATPTIFVLDDNKRIIGKPLGRKAVEKLLALE